MEPLVLLSMLVSWALSIWIAWRFMRAHERLADAVSGIAAKYRGMTGKASEPFILPDDADPQP
jgi:hypothetical protein